MIRAVHQYLCSSRCGRHVIETGTVRHSYMPLAVAGTRMERTNVLYRPAPQVYRRSQPAIIPTKRLL